MQTGEKHNNAEKIRKDRLRSKKRKKNGEERDKLE